MSEHEKQLNGEYHNPEAPELKAMRTNSRKFIRAYNEEIDEFKRYEILKQWLNKVGEKCYIEQPFFCDYGCHLSLGNSVYMNSNCTVLDSAQVFIGDHTLIGTNIQICTPSHPLDPKERRTGVERAKPVNIGKDCWIGSSVTIIGGVSIGDGVTIGAGSVVTKDIPSNVVAVGNPCRIIKQL